MFKQQKDREIFISIAIPTWNRYEEVIRAIKSIDIDRYFDIEIVICDNGSSEDLINKLESFCNKYQQIKLYKNDTNIGMTPNWNRAISLCSGEWITLLCSDDYFMDGGFEKVYNLIKNINDPCLIIQNPTIVEDIYLQAGCDTAKKINLPIASGNFLHKSIIKNCGLFDERIKYSPDAEYWVRISIKFPVLICSSEFAFHNLHDDNYMWHTWLKDDIMEQMFLIQKIG